MTAFQKFYWAFFAFAIGVSLAGLVLYMLTDIFAVAIGGIGLLFLAAALGQNYHNDGLP